MCPLAKTSHFEAILNELNKQRLSSVHCDVTLISDLGVSFPAHRCVLAASCGYFRDLLDQQRTGSILVLNDYSTDALQVFIEVIYTGRFQLPQNLDSVPEVKNLRHLATLLDLQTAVQLCDSYLQGENSEDQKLKSGYTLKKASSNKPKKEVCDSKRSDKKLEIDANESSDDVGVESPAEGGIYDDDCDYKPTQSAKKHIDVTLGKQGTRKSARLGKRQLKRYTTGIEESQERTKTKKSSFRKSKREKAPKKRKLYRGQIEDDGNSDLDDSIMVEGQGVGGFASGQHVDPVTQALNVAFGFTTDLGKDASLTPDPVEVEQTFNQIVKLLNVYKPQPKVEKRGRKPRIKIEVEEKGDTVGNVKGEIVMEEDQSVLEKFADITTRLAEQEEQSHLNNEDISNDKSDFDAMVSKSFKCIQERIEKRKETDIEESASILDLQKKPANAQEEQEWRNCPYCKQFRGKRKGRFEFHARYCSSQYRCHLCCKPFLNEFDLKRHQCAKEKKAVICEQCGKTLANSYALALHMQVHSGVKKHSCQYCGKLFMRACQRKAHVVHVHTTERPHKCEQCGKAFGLKYELNRHKQNHSTAYNFICTQCGTGFHEKHKLNQHVRVSHKPVMPQALSQANGSQITILTPSMTTQAENSSFSYPTVGHLPNSNPGESLIYAMVPASSLGLTDDLHENDVTFEVIQAIQGSYVTDQPNQDQETRLTTL